MTVEEPTSADAVIVVAPEAVTLAGLNVMDATPAESVSAVPPAGDMVPIAASVVKATTVFGTAAPVELVSVALTMAGEALDIEVTAAPDELTRERLIVPAAVVVVVPVVVPVVGVVVGVVPLVGAPLPPQLTNRAVIAANIKAVKVLV